MYEMYLEIPKFDVAPIVIRYRVTGVKATSYPGSLGSKTFILSFVTFQYMKYDTNCMKYRGHLIFLNIDKRR